MDEPREIMPGWVLLPLVSATAAAAPARDRELTRALARGLRRDVGLEKVKQAMNKGG